MFSTNLLLFIINNDLKHNASCRVRVGLPIDLINLDVTL